MSANPDTKNHPVVKALIAHQDRLGEGNALFARRYINVSEASWSTLKAGTYAAKDPGPMLERCEAALQMLNDQAERAEASPMRAKIIDLSHVRASVSAVKRCYGEPQNRFVVFLAPSGGGKTTLARKLLETYLGGAVLVEATETWRTSYFSAVLAVLEAMGESTDFPNVRAAETHLLDKLTVTPRILVIDEGHYLGPAALNLLKAVLNRTQTRVVLLAIPELFARMQQRGYEEAQQLRRRTFAKIVVPEVTLGDCRLFLAEKMPGYCGLKADEKRAVELACDAANKFGRFDTLQRLCDEMDAEADAQAATLDDVRAALKRVEALRS
jgi:type II secretory pathway predicted ATPase ExeA